MKKCSTCGTTYSGDLCPKCVADFAQKTSAPTADPAEELPLQPGQTFHGLEIVELLGRGGMGVVYKARQRTLDRLVALKILPRKMALDPNFQDRFTREAKALASLSHPNIVAVYDFGAENGLFFFVMEFIDGVNLRSLLRESSFTPEEAFKIVPQLCDALEYAHTEGVVHRDIKPENILIDKKGRVKIADFGLAKLVGADAQEHQLTRTNAVMGTPHYMAPEQIENPKGVDHRADIYSMGVVFYEMLTRELPIGRFDLPSKKVAVDVRLDEVVLKALEKQPERRYQRASEVKSDVTRVTSVGTADSYSPTVITPTPKARKQNLVFVAVVLVGFMAFALGAIYLATRSSPYSVVVQTTPETKSEETSPVKRPEDKTPPQVTPKPAGLERLHFDGGWSPCGFALGRTGTLVPRNPMPYKQPEEIDLLLQWLDNLEIANVTREDIKEGYLVAWYASGILALDTPVAESIERKFLSFGRWTCKWTYRNGNLLVLAFAGERTGQRCLTEMVYQIQEKLGLPREDADVKFEHVQYSSDSAPSGWELARGWGNLRLPYVGKTEEAKNALLAGLHGQIDLKAADVRAVYAVAFQPAGGAPSLYYVALEFEKRETARSAWKTLSDPKTRQTAGARKGEALIAGRTVVALYLHSEDLRVYEQVARRLREWMGYPEKTVDTLAPGEEDLPDGFSIESRVADMQKISERFDLPVLDPDTPINGVWVTLKPAGSVLVLDVHDSTTGNKIYPRLESRGVLWRSWNFMCLVEGPDDLEDLMRDKFDEDRQEHKPKEKFDLFLDRAGKHKMSFVRIKAGEFKMGEGDNAHRVHITQDYWMATTPVTQAQWQALMNSNPSEFKGADRPVEIVSWDEAQKFVAKINARRRNLKAALPTEAEWEYACRAGSQTTWISGNDDSSLGDYAWFAKNSSMETGSVAGKKPNGWGLYHMTGNVWQWCHDWHAEYGRPDMVAIDPSGPTEGKERVCRGGAFDSPAEFLRCAHRNMQAPGYRSRSVGFRLIVRPVGH